MHIKPTKIKTCMYTVGALNMTTRGGLNLRPRDQFPTENAMFILFCLRK